MQRSFDDLGLPLHEVTFVVLDLETTGGSADSCAITEVGAVKLRGGESLGTFQTLVNPGLPIPPEITYLTAITESMVRPAPRIESVLPAFLEFMGDAVIVGHNIRFDLSFIDTAASRLGYTRPVSRVVDTCMLARRLIREEVPNCKLGTLARYLRSSHQPTHRALDDALATGEVLHALLERAAAWGVFGLDDLLELPTVKGHPQVGKLALTATLPRSPGVYLFRDRDGRVLYVGKAVDLRRRVRSYFTGDDRRQVGGLLRELYSIDHRVCANELEASVLELRLIHELSPRYNRQGKRRRAVAYLKLTLPEDFPRLSVVRKVKASDGCLYIGPLPSTAVARQVADAIETVVPLRRCTKRVGEAKGRVVEAPCTAAQLGVATCPCAGLVTIEDYAPLVATAVAGLTGEPNLLLDPLGARMRSLAAARRYEEAADVRDRAATLSRVLGRLRRAESLRRAGRIRLEVPGEGGAVLDRGRLVDCWPAGASPDRLDFTSPSLLGTDVDTCVPIVAQNDEGPMSAEMADELAVVARWLDARAARIRLTECDSGLASPLPRLPRFEPQRRL